MSRMSARFVGTKVGLTAAGVYELWEAMGLVVKDRLGYWDLTDLGKSIGGRLSDGRVPVPTFDFDTIVSMMEDFWEKTHK